MPESIFPELERLRDDLGPEPLPGAAAARARGAQRSRRSYAGLAVLVACSVLGAGAAVVAAADGTGADGTPAAGATATGDLSYELALRARTLAPADLPGPRQLWGRWSLQTLLPEPLQDSCARRALSAGAEGVVTVNAGFLGAEGRRLLARASQATTAYADERSMREAYDRLSAEMGRCAVDEGSWLEGETPSGRVWHRVVGSNTRTVVLLSARDGFLTVLGLESASGDRGQAPHEPLEETQAAALEVLGVPIEPDAGADTVDAYRPGTDALVPPQMWPKGVGPDQVRVAPDTVTPCPLPVDDAAAMARLDRDYGVHGEDPAAGHETVVVLADRQQADRVVTEWSAALDRCAGRPVDGELDRVGDRASGVYTAAGPDGGSHRLMVGRVGNIAVGIRLTDAGPEQAETALMLALQGVEAYALPEPSTG
ncbi:hypothetical protein [Motilibacter aurantiacus]|uniref:hypothetical protein n=1 Tax=Motilibacter aurantiacus TaxID=2714955 RepID=UPI00140DD2C1|nr:hypothetical protein [Motilibacter aurantiacus]NHC43953.1 hypothetical protein [Motilibacter aurantiacus]